MTLASQTRLMAAAFCLLLAGCGAENLSIGNLSTSGTRISFRIANDGGVSGDVVFWVEQNGLEFCEHVTRILAHRVHTITLGCPSLHAGQFVVRVFWASAKRDRALVATRID